MSDECDIKVTVVVGAPYAVLDICCFSFTVHKPAGAEGKEGIMVRLRKLKGSGACRFASDITEQKLSDAADKLIAHPKFEEWVKA